MYPADRSRGGWILVVDDDADIRELMELTLAVRGYEVESAADGAQACERLAARTGAGLILLDLRMPRMDGAEFLHRLRSGPQAPGPPVVVLSGDVGADQLASRLGVKQTLRKPFELRDLLSVVAEHVGPPPELDRPGSGALP